MEKKKTKKTHTLRSVCSLKYLFLKDCTAGLAIRLKNIKAATNIGEGEGRKRKRWGNKHGRVALHSSSHDF